MDVPGSEPREHPVDIERMTVDARFDTEKGRVIGRVTHKFKVLQKQVDSIVFDAVKIKINQATLSGKPVRYRNTDTTVVVYCNPSLAWDVVDSVVFLYEATPRKGIYFVGWGDPSKRMRRQIWTQGQAVDNRHWIPMYDEMNDKMITETITTFDSTYKVLSNGTLIEVLNNSDGTKTWHYRMSHPHSSYLLMLAIGEFNITTRKSASGVPLHLYSYPEHPEYIEPTYRMSVEAMDFLEQEIGVKYPWESYSQVPVADFIFGAMENTTATVFGDFFHTDSRGWLDRSYVGVNVHELTHQWFGDLITGRSIKSIWLQESFATFYPHLFSRSTHGEDAFEWSRRGMQRSALSAGEKDRLPIVHPSSGTARVYPKGAVVIDMMRYAFGESAVRRAIKHYLLRNAYSNVETNDLYLSFQDTLGLSPSWFFEQWIYKGGEPHYRVSTRLGSVPAEKGKSSTTFVDIEQIHLTDNLTGFFKMPVVVEVHYTDRSKDSTTVVVENQRTIVEVPNTGNKPVAFVLFDPGSHILKNVTFDKPWEMRALQRKNAPRMIDRFDALESLRGDSSRVQERLGILEDVMNRETFHAMRSEAVIQALEMANTGVLPAWKIVERGILDKAVEVRSTAVNGLSIIPLSLKGACERLLEDSSFAVLQTAFTRLARSFPLDRSRYISKIARENGPHERIRITRLEIEASDGSATALEELADLCGPGWEFVTRQNAMGAFRRLGSITPGASRNICSALFSTNSRLSSAAASTLANLAEQTRNREIIRQSTADMVSEEWQRELLQPFVK